jgi:hypothetical protein
MAQKSDNIYAAKYYFLLLTDNYFNQTNQPILLVLVFNQLQLNTPIESAYVL